MSERPKALTLKSSDKLRRIITECTICSTAEDGKESVSCMKYNALWDTGATNSTISERVIEDLGLSPFSFVNVSHAAGVSTVGRYKVNLNLPMNVGFRSLSVLGGKLTGFDILIGMDIIANGDLAITNRGGGTVFSFQIPSTHLYDFVKQLESQDTTKKNPRRR